MRRTIIAIVAGLGWTGAAAQDWITQGSPAEGWTGATTCVPGTDGTITALCLSLGCRTGLGPGAILSLSEAPPADEVAATILVDGVLAGTLGFRPDGTGITYGAPLDEQDGLIEALRRGTAGEIRIEMPGHPQVIHPLSLAGSGAAIGAVLAACPSPASEPQPPGIRTSDDPAGEAVAENEAHCSGGTADVEPGFVRRADVDGDGSKDLVLDYVGLTCDGSRAFCGTGGCTQEIWLADPAGPYRLLVSGLIEEVLLPEPGIVTLRLDGGECGRSGAEVCDRTYAVRDGLLVRKP